MPKKSFSYSGTFSTKQTPQDEPAFGREKEQVKNYAGGYVFEADAWDIFDRFLILGTAQPTYYASARKLTKEAVTNFAGLVIDFESGKKFVDRIVEISISGRAPKNDSALFALAFASSVDDTKTRQYALSKLPDVARIGTHLFQFIEYVENFRGWGDSLKKAVQKWFLNKDVNKLAYQLAKYQQRGGWSNRDVLRLCHPKTDDKALNALFAWVVGKPFLNEELPRIIDGMMEIHNNPQDAVKLITDYGLTREMVPTELLSRADVWEALLDKMPMTAMLRNLGNMSKVGLLVPFSNAASVVYDRLHNQEYLQKSKIHPMNVITALRTYSAGHGVKGKGNWNPVNTINDALESAFYLSFKNVVPSGKNTMIALDVSNSMDWLNISGYVNFTSRDAAAVMSMVTIRSEPNYMTFAFSTNFQELQLNKTDNLNGVIRKCKKLYFGGTDCSLPMLYAIQNNLPIDNFIIYTDNETWSGGIHPFQALQKYRQKSGRNAKMIVQAFTATDFTIADPSDNGMLDVVGLDSASPAFVADFCRD